MEKVTGSVRVCRLVVSHARHPACNTNSKWLFEKCARKPTAKQLTSSFAKRSLTHNKGPASTETTQASI